MKVVSGVIRAHKLDEVHNALTRLGVRGMTAREVRDYSPRRRRVDVWRGVLYTLPYSVKCEISMVVDDDDVDEVVSAIITTARTGQPGDGDVSVRPVEHRYDIRTGARGTS